MSKDKTGDTVISANVLEDAHLSLFPQIDFQGTIYLAGKSSLGPALTCYVRLSSCLVSALCRKEQNCPHIIRTTVILCVSPARKYPPIHFSTLPSRWTSFGEASSLRLDCQEDRFLFQGLAMELSKVSTCSLWCRLEIVCYPLSNLEHVKRQLRNECSNSFRSKHLIKQRFACQQKACESFGRGRSSHDRLFTIASSNSFKLST